MAGSSQLMNARPSGATARFGSPLPAGAGDFSSVTEGAGAAARPARIANKVIHLVMVSECITRTSEPLTLGHNPVISCPGVKDLPYILELARF